MDKQRDDIDCAERAAYAIHNINNIVTIIIPNLLKLRANGHFIEPEDVRQRQLELIGNLLGKMERMLGIIKSQQKEYRQFLEQCPVDIELMVNDIITLIPEDILQRLKIEKAISLDTKPHLDYIKLYQVLSNLVLNAVESLRVSQQQEMLLTVKAVKIVNELQIEITDNGVGIESNLISCIWRAGHSSKPGGTGLGLAYCKKVIEREMKGEITVSSSGIGQGASFYLRLPGVFL